MATVVEHLCNPRASDKDEPPRIFRNDANNVSELQRARLQKKRAETTARIQQEKLDSATQDLKHVQDERDRLREDVESLKKALEKVDEDCKDLRNKMSMLVGEKKEKERELENALSQQHAAESLLKQRESELSTANTATSQYLQQVNSLKDTVAQQSSDLQRLRSTVTSMEYKLPNSRLDNCLPYQYHDATVMFVNLKSQRTIDAGKDYSTLAHGWDLDLTNPNQIFKLQKSGEVNNPDSLWMIAQRLYLDKRGPGVELQVGSGAGRQDLWRIGRGSSGNVGSWVIQNVRWHTVLEMENESRANYTRIVTNELGDREIANWIIIPREFTS